LQAREVDGIMAKSYTTLRIRVETHQKLVKARGKLEYRTGEKHSLEKTIEKALDSLLKEP
jgi:hypothetical protein